LRQVLRDLEVLRDNLISIKHKIDYTGGYNLPSYNLNKAIRLVENQISETVEYIKVLEEKGQEEEL